MKTRTASLVPPANGRPASPPWLPATLAAILAASLILALAGPAGAADDDDDDGGEYVDRQLVAALTPAGKIGYINRKYNTSTVGKLPSEMIYLLRTPPRADPAALAARIERNEPSRVVYVEQNFETGLPEGSGRHRARPGGVPDPSGSPEQYRGQYAVEALNLSAAHALNEGQGTVVAVIDTGVQAGHPALADRLTQERYDFVDGDRNPADVGNGRNEDRDGETDETVGHGTHVAGIVALAAPEARIMPVRALDSEGRGTSFGVARAITFALANGADVVNLSLGTSQESDLIEDVIEADDDDGAMGQGAFFVAAAGNDDNDQLQYPAAEEDVVAVTSVDDGLLKSDFANYDTKPLTPWIDVAAPGSGIYGPFPNGLYASWSGTSMATPFVAGQAALVHSASGSGQIDAACVADVITANVQPLPAQPLGGRLGSGLADAAASVSAAQTSPCSLGGDDD